MDVEFNMLYYVIIMLSPTSSPLQRDTWPYSRCLRGHLGFTGVARIGDYNEYKCRNIKHN